MKYNTTPYKNIINEGMTGGRVELPFDAPIFWWHRGEPGGIKTASGVLHYGGWASAAEDIEAKFAEIPPRFIKEDFVSASNNTYQVYATRSMSLAFFAKRFRWMVDASVPGDRGKGHTQYLAYCALWEPDQKCYKPWSPVVLTARSMSGMALDNTIKEFAKITQQARRQWADNTPAYFFYATVGTFGERKTKEVGEGTRKNYITPPMLGIEGEITEERLASWYVGDDVAAEMARLKGEAKEWLDHWNSQREKADKADNKPRYAPDEYGTPPPENWDEMP